jgi:pyruvate/2-oxoglutarate dehydrogenase complex dihydrolipoamide acyltransferase (E2) component
MKIHQLRLPEIAADERDKVSLASWLFAEGDKIQKDDELVELITDKATFSLESPCSGVLRKILASEGAELKLNQLLAEIEEE